MKILIKKIGFATLFIYVVYVLASFIELNLNILEWREGMRIGVSLVIFLAFFVIWLLELG